MSAIENKRDPYGPKTPAEEKYAKRVQLLEDAIALKEPERVPMVPMIGTVGYNLYGSSYKDALYNYDKAADAMFKFYEEFQPDAQTHNDFVSGRANELAGTKIIDWPGRPGTKLADRSIHQVIEHEFMEEDEYEEVSKDFTGFMLRKFIPRAYPNLKGLESVGIVPSVMLNTTPLGGLYTKEAVEAYELLAKIGREDLKAAEASEALGAKIESIGIPPQYTGGGQAPYDIVGDYFRGTMAMLTDQLEYADEIEVLCDRMADIQIEGWQYFKYVDMPVKSVFFPLHKGMDGFMSPEIYHRLYWKPLKKCVEALVDMGVTPYLYTEGKYDSRLEQLTDVPKGKVVYHFESVDIQRAKQVLGGTACISGNLPLYTLEYGTPQQVIDETKRLIDICAPGGGYMFDAAGSLDNVPRANVEALFDTVQTYGKK